MRVSRAARQAAGKGGVRRAAPSERHALRRALVAWRCARTRPQLGRAAPGMASSSYELKDGVLTVPLHVLSMPGGRIAVPNTTNSLYVEIGTNAFSTWDAIMLPQERDAFLVAFEPLVDKWALLLARNARSRTRGKLGHHHSRGVVLPFAVSDREGLADFYVAPRDGCSSLRAMHAPRHGSWNISWFRTQCARSVEVRRVPTVSLRTVLGQWLPGWRVKRMKVDVQGADLAVLSAAGSELQRVDEVSMEVLNDACDGMYDGQPNCSTIVRTMRSLGFLTLKSCSAPGTFHRFQGFGCERDFLFYRAERGPPGPAGRGARKRAGGGGRSRRAVVARGVRP